MGSRIPQLTFKFVLVGDSFVGKTCMCKMFCDNEFDEAQTQTIALEFGNRTVTINGIQIKIQLWDTAGQERFRSITRTYFRSAVAVFAVFDVTNRKSFSDLAVWVEDTINLAPQTAVHVIVGNKTDLLNQRAVTEAEAAAFAAEHGFSYFETSALSGTRIEETFIETANVVYKKFVDGKIDLACNRPRADSFDQDLADIGVEPTAPKICCF